MQATIAGTDFALTADELVAAVAGEIPEPIRDHFVVIGKRRYPPKQVISLVTGLDRGNFTTHHALRILQRLGFNAGRKGRPPGVKVVPPVPEGLNPAAARQAEALRPFMGRWVALRGLDDVVFDADSPQEIVAWIRRHGQRGDMVLGVPLDPRTLDLVGPC